MVSTGYIFNIFYDSCTNVCTNLPQQVAAQCCVFRYLTIHYVTLRYVTKGYVALSYSIICWNESCSLMFPNQIHPAGPGIRPSLPNSKYGMKPNLFHKSSEQIAVTFTAKNYGVYIGFEVTFLFLNHPSAFHISKSLIINNEQVV